MKNTVPPGTLLPLGFVGWVYPGPLTAVADPDDADSDDCVLLLLLDPLDPQALTTTTIVAAAIATTVLRTIFRMLRILLRMNGHLLGTSCGSA